MVVLFNGCREQQDKYQVITTRIQYDVPVVSADPQLHWWVNNLEGSRREPFIRRILEAARDGNVKAYDYFNQPLTPEEVCLAGNDTLVRTFVRNYPPYEQYDTMVVVRTDYEDVMKLRFLEEWSWDPATLEFVKKVVGICPLAEIRVGEAVYNRPLFWIYLDERYPGILEGDQ
jgi:hypothetical protein